MGTARKGGSFFFAWVIIKTMELKEKKISGQKIYKGKILDLEVDEVICPNGHHSKREVVRHCPGACLIVKLGDRFVIEEQYRYPYDEVILEFPAGKLDQGETPLEGAKRELEEETGLQADKVVNLGAIYPSVGYTDEIIHIFYAEAIRQVGRHLDDNEAINLKLMSLEEIEEAVKNGKIKDSKTICALAYYRLYLKDQAS